MRAMWLSLALFTTLFLLFVEAFSTFLDMRG
jgi:hypothetical protein